MATSEKKTSKKTTKKASNSRGSAAGRKLVIVESPAKAKTINRYLGDDFIVKASMGHVRDLPQSKLGVDLENNFQPTYEPLQGRQKVLAELKKLAKGAPEIYLATDLDREGEAIAWHLLESLASPGQTVRRVIFNEITASAIKEAFAHPLELDMNKVNAQQARRILDRIVGYQVSPLLWKKVAKGLSAGRVQSVAVRMIVERERLIDAFDPEEYWKIGSVFTPDLAAAENLAQRWQELLASDGKTGSGPTQADQQEFLAANNAFKAELASWRGEKFQADSAEQTQEIALALGLDIDEIQRTENPEAKKKAKFVAKIIGKLGSSGPKFTVAAINEKNRQSKPSAPLTTATLQQAASSQLRFGAAKTMRVAQMLYEGVDLHGEGHVGLITYMRTDSRNLAKVAIDQARGLISSSYGDAYLPATPNIYSAGKRAQEAHEAIRPTDVTRTPKDLANTLERDQLRLYELIWKRTVACQMTPAVWAVTDVDVAAETPAGEAIFKASGRKLVFDGFLRVAGLPKSGDQILPELTEKAQVAPASLQPTQHFTQPLPRYTEAALVKAMESAGIGRPSTYAPTIQTIQQRNYVELIDRSLVPSELGKVVTDKLVQHFPKVFDLSFTAHMEDQLDKVEDSQAEWTEVLEEFYKPFKVQLEAATENMEKAAEPSEYKCEACGMDMIYKVNKNGRFLACTGYPDCKKTHPVDKDGVKQERKEVDAECPKCSKSMILRRSRFGPFLGCSDYPECKGTMPCDAEGNPKRKVTEAELAETCEDCGAKMAVKWKGMRAFLGCTRYPECKGTGSLPDDVYLEPPPKAEPKDAGVDCPKCGKKMLIRSGRRGEFIACSGYPKCRNALDLSKLEDLKAGKLVMTDTAKPKKAAKKKAKKKTAKKKAVKKTAKKAAKKASSGTDEE